MRDHPNIILLTLILCLATSFTTAQEKADTGVELKAREPWTTVFGGESLILHFDVSSKLTEKHTALWSYAAGERRLAAGELNITIGADGSGTIKLPLRIPPVKDGVIFETVLTVSVLKDGKTVASLSKPITIYPDNPFTNKENWLEELSISLYDPDGKTAERFKEAGIPCHQMGTLASLKNVQQGILVIGEGLSLKTQRGMFDILTDVASRGIPVLCLASTEGTFPLPFASDNEFPKPYRVLMDRFDVITRFDKRFDSQAWGTAGNPAVSSLQIEQSRTEIEMEVSESPAGWSWLELKYGERGVLVWSGFGIIEHWEESPTPRYLLLRIFEELSDTERLQPVSHDKPRSLP